MIHKSLGRGGFTSLRRPQHYFAFCIFIFGLGLLQLSKRTHYKVKKRKVRLLLTQRTSWQERSRTGRAWGLAMCYFRSGSNVLSCKNGKSFLLIQGAGVSSAIILSLPSYPVGIYSLGGLKVNTLILQSAFSFLKNSMLSLLLQNFSPQRP